MDLPYIDFHSHKETSVSDILTIRSFDTKEITQLTDQPSSLGIHPWSLNRESYPLQLEILEKYSMDKNIFFLGETGLDTLVGEDKELQEESFRFHIQLSEQIQKPIVVHCVRSYHTLFKIHKIMKPKQKWILHGFQARRDVFIECTRRGFYFSLGNALIKNSSLRSYVSEIPRDKIFFESDDSSFAIEKLYQEYSLLTNQSISDLKKQIASNFLSLDVPYEF